LTGSPSLNKVEGKEYRLRSLNFSAKHRVAGSLTAPGLSHHRTCRSAYGGSRKTPKTTAAEENDVSIQEIYSQLTRDENRNDMIFNDLLASLERKSSPLLLTERTEHVEYLAGRLEKFARNVIAMRGGLGKRQRAEIAERIAAIPEGEERVLIATGRYIGEGFDDARLDTLFLALPISWKGTLQQYAGRLHRLYDRKKTAMVYDYIDSNVPVLMRMYQKRLKGYRAMGYAVKSI
jgi:superfamily II DNA or RNA helicase